jgi:HEPN domain-containing protein
MRGGLPEGSLDFRRSAPAEMAHDVGTILLDHASRFPQVERKVIEEMAFISRNLRADREKSMYGDDILRLPPDRLYSRLDAESARAWVEKVYSTCSSHLGLQKS